MNTLFSVKVARSNLEGVIWLQEKHSPHEIQSKLAWMSLDALCSLSGLRGAIWRYTTGKNQTPLVEIANFYGCSEDRVRLICSDIARQLLIMGFSRLNG